MHRVSPIQICRMLAMVLTALLTACSTPAPDFVAPAQRTLSPTQQPWPANHVLILAYHDVQDQQPDQRFIAVHTHHLAQHFAWLRENDYAPVSVEQILQARSGGPSLPEKAVLLTFDDGYTSFRERVLPLLQAYGWPAVLAPVGAWADTPADQAINFGGQPVQREHFLTWQAIRDIHASGLVEIASHSNNLHFGVPANPQGNTQPAAATRIYDAATSSYEGDQAYGQRITEDAQAITRKISAATGQRPRVWIWPYGEANGEAIRVLKEQGYELIMTLDWGLADINKPDSMPRLLVSDDPDLPAFSNTVLAMEESNLMRAVRLELDALYDPDPEVAAQKLGNAVQRIADLKINAVVISPFSYASTGDITAAYFPARNMPLQADLFNRVAWQLRTRAGVSVYALMPLEALRSVADLSEAQTINLAQDLARYSNFAGVIVQNSTSLNPSNAGNQQTTDALAHRLVQEIQNVRGPQVRTGVVLDPPEPNVEPDAQQLAQQIQRLLNTYDWAVVNVALSVPGQDKEAIERAGKLADVLNKRSGQQKRMVFLVNIPAQALGPEHQTPELRSRRVAQALMELQRRGLPSVAYGPDDPQHDIPRLLTVRPALSTAWYPYK